MFWRSFPWFRVAVSLACVLSLAPAAPSGVPAAHAAETAQPAGDDGASSGTRARAAVEEDDDDAYAPPSHGRGSMFSRGSGLLGTVLMAAGFYFFMMRGRGGAGSSNWGSYYLFWIIAPMLIALVTSHPAVLLVVVVGLVARRWLPDPFLAIKHAGRIRKLGIEVSANPGNITARRDLASIWLEKRRPKRALPLLDQALQRDPDSTELLFLKGAAQLGLKQPDPALASFLNVVHGSPNFRYGEAYLRAGDALTTLGRLEDAEEALGHYLKINSSSIEALYKLGCVRKARGDAPGAARAHAELRDVWHLLPGFQRRKQLGWYLRARIGR